MIYVMSMNNQVPRIQYDAASSNRRFEEQRITPNIDATVNPSDVLCGRGKSSFTHGKLLFAHNSIAVEAEAAAGCCFAAAVQLHTSYNTGLRCCCSENSDYQSLTPLFSYFSYPCYAVGNTRFRDAITSAIDEYNESESRLAKSRVVQRIVERIKGEGGRFLKRDHINGGWVGKYHGFYLL